MASVPEKEEGRIATPQLEGSWETTGQRVWLSFLLQQQSQKTMYTQGSVTSREAANMISVRDSLATSLLEFHRGGNKNVEILDTLYLDFHVAFDNFSAKAMKIS